MDTRYGNWGTESGQGRSYVTVDDEKGVATTNVYDAYGRMRYVIADSAGTSAATAYNRTSYAHDSLDRLTSTTMPGGGTSRYTYDTLGRMISRHHPDADAAAQYKYDDLGRLRFSQDALQHAAGTGKVTFTRLRRFRAHHGAWARRRPTSQAWIRNAATPSSAIPLPAQPHVL